MRFVSNWKLAVLLVLAFAGTIQARGCTDGEIIASGVGLVVGASLANSSNHGQTCHQELGRRECWTVYDYYGNPAGRQCDRRSYTVCERYKMDMNSGTASAIDSDAFATANKISHEAADQFINVLKTAQAGDEAAAKAALSSICLNVEDFKSVSNGGSVSAEKNDCIAKSLNQDPRVVSAMVESIVETGRAQQAARNQNHNN